MTELIEVEFVNRDEELVRVREMRAGQRSARILLIKGRASMGKSWLLRRIKHEHKDLQVGLVHLGHHYALDPIALIRELSIQMSDVAWTAVNQLLAQVGKHYTITIHRNSPVHSPAAIHFGDNTNISGDVVGGDKIMFPGSEEPLVREQLVADLSQAFVKELATFQPVTPAIILLDGYERRTSIMEQWLLQTFLHHIGDGTLTGVLLIVAGQDVPSFDRSWRLAVESTELDGIPLAAIYEYWIEKRKLPESEVQQAVKFSRGDPQLLAQMADNASLPWTLTPGDKHEQRARHG